ncbi:MAG: hypothetical protein ACK559_34215, partial [bacterium]
MLLTPPASQREFSRSRRADSSKLQRPELCPACAVPALSDTVMGPSRRVSLDPRPRLGQRFPHPKPMFRDTECNARPLSPPAPAAPFPPRPRRRRIPI